MMFDIDEFTCPVFGQVSLEKTRLLHVSGNNWAFLKDLYRYISVKFVPFDKAELREKITSLASSD